MTGATRDGDADAREVVDDVARAWALSGLAREGDAVGTGDGATTARTRAEGSVARASSSGVGMLSATLRRIDSGLLLDETRASDGGGAAATRKLSPDDFEILKLVGQGAFGKVFQVKKRDSGNIYAMKVMKKDRILEKDQVEYTRAERDILTAVTHPFIVNLRYSFQTTSKLYLIMEFINGGHLFFQLYQQGTFGDALTRFYAAEICLAVGHLHSLSIVHRDLKPENILVDGEGHVKITDFGLAKKIAEDGRANSLAGSIDYMAPEILSAKGHGKTADWWSVGVLIFEMLSGSLPFKGKNKAAVQKAICTEKVKVPTYFQPDAVGLIKGLLSKDASMRLGRGETGTADVKGHKYFKGVDWNKIAAKAIAPPFKPNVNGRHCVANFDARWTDVDPVDSVAATPVSGEQEKFMGFTFVSNFMEEAAAKLERSMPKASPARDDSGSDSEASSAEDDERRALESTLDELDLSDDEKESTTAPRRNPSPAVDVRRPPLLRADATSFAPTSSRRA